MSSAGPAPAPVVLDRYRLQRRLGAGAFGSVWLARDERLQRDVAVKILARAHGADGRFEREARAAARLSHPAIVTLYEAAVDDEGAYLVSELVPGSTLADLLAEGRLSDRDVLEVGIALCDALAHAHAHGIVHRDVKPSNVLVPDTPGAPGHVAKLTDFGVAHLPDGRALTRTGDVIGTLDYMAPEQAEGLEAGPAADLYALALVLYEALTGVNPLAAHRGMTITGRPRRLGVHVPPLRRQRRDLPHELGQAVDRALRPHPRERGSLGELRDALEAARHQVGDEPGTIAAPPTLATFVRPGPRADAGWEDGWRDGDALAPAASAPLLEPGDGLGGRPWPRRAAAAAAAAALVAWLLQVALVPAPVAPPAGALAAAAAVLILPRLGWLALTAALPLTAVVQGHGGAAVLLAVALALPILVLPLRATLWPLLTVAPALAILGAGGAWPALAGHAGSPWRRAMLALGGWAWLLLAAPLAGRSLYLAGRPAAAGAHVLVAAVTSGAVAGGAIWAAGAVLLPWLTGPLVRARPMLQIVVVAAWAAATAAALNPAITALAGPGRAHPSALAGSLILGAVGAAAVALAPAVRIRTRWGSTRPRLS